MPRVLHSGEGADWGSGRERDRKIQQANCPQQSEITGTLYPSQRDHWRDGNRPRFPAPSWDPANTSHAAALPRLINGNQVHEVIPAICHFHTLNRATWRRILACTSCTVKLSWSEETGTEACQCLCTPMLCLLFSGDSPSSLAAVQDLFSPSLYVTTNRTTEAAPLSFLFFSFPDTSFFFTFPQSDIQLGVRDVTVYLWTHDTLFCHLWDHEVSPQTAESRFKT